MITSLARWIVRAGGVVVSYRPPTQEVGGSIPVSGSSAVLYSEGLQKLGTEHGTVTFLSEIWLYTLTLQDTIAECRCGKVKRHF